MIPISSSVIKAIDYNSTNRVLRIKFKNGKTYKYRRVPEAIFLALLNARSAGEFFNDHIKGRYE